MERRSTANAGELEELRKLLEAAEKGKKTAESELREAMERISELTANVSSLNTQKRMMENDIHVMQVSFRLSLCVFLPACLIGVLGTPVNHLFGVTFNYL